MPKMMTVCYTATWLTEIEVPDDFRGDSEDIFQAVSAKCDTFDFSDGGADWQLDRVELDGEEIPML